MDFKSKEEALDFLVRAGIVRPNERTLEGQEKADMLLILTLLTPYKDTNNQRFWTEQYEYGKNQYTITFFDENEYEIIEISQ